MYFLFSDLVKIQYGQTFMSVTSNWDVFNGDADGICSLLQLRLAEPKQAQLITGVKRDIELLQQVDPKAGDQVTVLDISLDKNRHHLQRVLNLGAEVFYVDHHYAGEVPSSAALKTLINEAPEVCTSLLVNHYLSGEHSGWAVVGAFGDNLKKSASGLAKSLSLSASDLSALERLGVLINYNGYGENITDLHFHPEELYKLMLPFENPLDFISDCHHQYERLESGYQDDLQAAINAEILLSKDSIAVYLLPDQSWAQRVSGVFGNQLANQHPDRGHAVLTAKSNGSYLVSVRAPLNSKQGAADLCRQFPSGGGREAAAGINELPAELLEDFIRRFEQSYE